VTERQIVVGSQKRKARKDTIKPRRIDVVGMPSGIAAHPNMGEQKPTIVDSVPDLFGLATLAEVAANESKLNEDKN
jgi:hypothetical protein